MRPKRHDVIIWIKIEIYIGGIYKKMEDVELVLRFFALRNVEHFRRGMEGFLDLYMMKSLNFSTGDIIFLKNILIIKKFDCNWYSDSIPAND